MNAKKIIFGVVFTLGAALYGDPLGEVIKRGRDYSNKLGVRCNIDTVVRHFWQTQFNILSFNQDIIDKGMSEEEAYQYCRGVVYFRMKPILTSLTTRIMECLVDKSKGEREQEAEKENIEKNITFAFLMCMWEGFDGRRCCFEGCVYGKPMGNAFRDVLKRGMQSCVSRFGVGGWLFEPGAVQKESPYRGGVELFFVAINELCQGVKTSGQGVETIAESSDPFAGIVGEAMENLRGLGTRVEPKRDLVKAFNTMVGNFISWWKRFCTRPFGHEIWKGGWTESEGTAECVRESCKREFRHNMSKCINTIVGGLSASEDQEKGITLALFIKIWQACLSDEGIKDMAECVAKIEARDVAECTTECRGIVREVLGEIFSLGKIVNGLSVTGGLPNSVFAHLMESDVSSIALRALILAEARKLVLE